MNNTIGGSPKTPWHLWAVGIISLLWNSGGIISYSMTKFGMLEGGGMSGEQIEYISNFPAWATAFWALGVWGCFFGSLALLFRSRYAVWLIGVSLIGLAGTTAYQRLFSELPEAFATTGQSLFAAAIWVITLGLFFYANRMKQAGVLR